MKLFPQGLEKLECKTAWYGIDTHMDLQKHLEVAKFFDVTFLAQKEYIKYFTKKGLINTFWLPLAYDCTMAPTQTFKKIYDIAYVGSNNKDMHPIRFELIEKLKKSFQIVTLVERVGKRCIRYNSQAKVVFNKSINNDINMRYFEALGNGAMLLTDKIKENGVEELFEKDKHYIEYGRSNIIEIAKNYLETQKDDSDILKEHTYQNHTYDIRSTKIAETIKLCEKRPKNITRIDYAKVYLMLENFIAFLESLKSIISDDIIKDSRKIKIGFCAIVGVIVIITILVLKKYIKRS
ncbi:glycosyltransferase [Vibrio sp. PP-XX7]